MIDLPESTVRSGFDPASWDMVGSLALSQQLVSGDVLIELAARDDRICVLTADLGRPTRVYGFNAHYPERYFNFGIMERTMVSAAAGLAATGLRPYVSNYACFLAILATEQIRTDVAYPDLPVTFIGTHSGLAMGFYGTSHHATEDIGFLRSIANLTIVAPVDAMSLRQALGSTAGFDHPLYIRTGRGRETPVYTAPIPGWHIGGSHRLRDGGDVTIVATGTRVEASLRAAEELAAAGIDAGVIDAYSLKPLDTEAIAAAARSTPLIVTVEEHNIVGGLGSAVAEVLAETGGGARLRRIGLRDTYSILGPPTHLYKHYGLDGPGIAATVRGALA